MAKVSLSATLTHDEAKLDFLKVAWKSFLADLPTMGFAVESEFVGHVTDADKYIVHSDPIGPDDGGDVPSWATALAAETHTAVDTEDDIKAEPTLKEIKTGIKALKSGIGGNRVLSQKEMAEALGVSRYQIRKALGKR